MNQSKIEKRQPEPLMNNEKKVQGKQVSPSIANAVLAGRCLSIDEEIALYEHYLDEFCDADCKLKSCNPDAIFNWFKNKIPKLPTVDEAGVASVRIIETIEPQLSEQEQAFFIAGFQECIKWLSVNAR